MKEKEQKNDRVTDEDIRDLVIARLSVLSPDTMKSIGNRGAFTRDELISHVEKGDEISKIITNVEMEWLRAMKTRLRGTTIKRL